MFHWTPECVEPRNGINIRYSRVGSTGAKSVAIILRAGKRRMYVRLFFYRRKPYMSWW